MPLSLGLIKSELIGSANWSFGMYPGLSIGAINTLLLHASEEQKQSELASQRLVIRLLRNTFRVCDQACGGHVVGNDVLDGAPVWN